MCSVKKGVGRIEHMRSDYSAMVSSTSHTNTHPHLTSIQSQFPLTNPENYHRLTVESIVLSLFIIPPVLGLENHTYRGPEMSPRWLLNEIFINLHISSSDLYDFISVYRSDCVINLKYRDLNLPCGWCYKEFNKLRLVYTPRDRLFNLPR